MAQPQRQKTPKNRWPITEAFLLGWDEVPIGYAYGDAWQRALGRYARPTPWTGYSGVNPYMNQPSTSVFEAYMDGTYARISWR